MRTIGCRAMTRIMAEKMRNLKHCNPEHHSEYQSENENRCGNATSEGRRRRLSLALIELVLTHQQILGLGIARENKTAEKALTNLKARILERCRDIIMKVSRSAYRRYSDICPDFKEIYQETVTVFLEILSNYRPNLKKIHNFTSYALVATRQALHNTIKNSEEFIRTQPLTGEQQRPQIVYMSQPINGNDDADDEIEFQDVLVDDSESPLETVSRADLLVRIREVLPLLPCRTEYIVRQRYIYGKKLSELASVFSISIERVRQIEASGIKRLRELISQSV